jgi:hypothetical protein
MDSGAMLRGWNERNVRFRGGDSIEVFNPDPKQIIHEYGTKKNYPIVPKRAKALALPSPGGVARYTLEGLGKSKKIDRRSYLFNPTKKPPARYAGRTGKPVVPYTDFIFRKKVNHPGIPARPVLPVPAVITPKLKAVGQAYFKSNLFKDR